MPCKLQPLQSGLFDQPSVELAPAQMKELAALVEDRNGSRDRGGRR